MERSSDFLLPCRLLNIRAAADLMGGASSANHTQAYAQETLTLKVSPKMPLFALSKLQVLLPELF